VEQLRITIIRDDTNVCEGKVRDYVEPYTMSHTRTAKDYRRKKPKDAARARIEASGSGEHGDKAEDDCKPSEYFDFHVDEMNRESSAAPRIKQQPQQQEQASHAPDALPAYVIADKPDEMDWKGHAPSAAPHVEQFPQQDGRSGETGTLPTLPTQDSRARFAHQGETRSRESSIESIAASIVLPLIEGNIVSRRPIVGSRITKRQRENRGR
jgi:hypothetical protein